MNAGWKTVKLGDVARYDKAQGIHSGLPYVGLEHIESGTRKFIGSRSDMEVHSSTFLFNPNHVLYGRLRPYLRKVLVPDFAGHCSTEIFPILPSDDLDRSYLSYWLITESTTGAIDRLCNGARMPRANMEQALELEIPLPPLAEQKRIVALLDEAFAGIDEAKAKAECNNQASADLLESRLSELFLKPEETPSMISDHCTDVTVGYVGPMADKYVPNGIPFLRSQNVRPFEINFDNLMQITPGFEKSLAKSRLAPGDVVVVRTGYPGTAAVIPTELPMANCADLVILRPMKSLDPNYLVAFFNSKVGKDMVLGRLVGAAQKHFNVGAAKSVLLPIPTIQRQREVVSHISEIRTHIGKLMDNSEIKLSELSELKASTLAQAFAGELTA